VSVEPPPLAACALICFEGSEPACCLFQRALERQDQFHPPEPPPPKKIDNHSQPGRPDKDQFNATVKGSAVDGAPDESWLDIRSANVRSVMRNVSVGRVQSLLSPAVEGAG